MNKMKKPDSISKFQSFIGSAKCIHPANCCRAAPDSPEVIAMIAYVQATVFFTNLVCRLVDPIEEENHALYPFLDQNIHIHPALFLLWSKHPTTGRAPCVHDN